VKALTSATTNLFLMISLWVCLTHTSGDTVPLYVLVLSVYIVSGGWGGDFVHKTVINSVKNLSLPATLMPRL
jgi:hypothetical protein